MLWGAKRPCYIGGMRNRLFFPLMAVIAAVMVALALNWPEGEAGRGIAPAPAEAPPVAPAG